MIQLITRFLQSYGYESSKEFGLSILPSFKYGLHNATVMVSALMALITEFMGVGPTLALAMLVAVVTEMWTGIKASRISGKHFESFRFSRCIIKLCIWLSIIFIVHSFYKDLSHSEDILGVVASVFFSVVKLFIMMWFVFEHVISILENLAVIDGKPKEALVIKLENCWDDFTNLIKRKANEK